MGEIVKAIVGVDERRDIAMALRVMGARDVPRLVFIPVDCARGEHLALAFASDYLLDQYV